MSQAEKTEGHNSFLEKLARHQQGLVLDNFGKYITPESKNRLEKVVTGNCHFIWTPMAFYAHLEDGYKSKSKKALTGMYIINGASYSTEHNKLTLNMVAEEILLASASLFALIVPGLAMVSPLLGLGYVLAQKLQDIRHEVVHAASFANEDSAEVARQVVKMKKIAGPVGGIQRRNPQTLEIEHTVLNEGLTIKKTDESVSHNTYLNPLMRFTSKVYSVTTLSKYNTAIKLAYGLNHVIANREGLDLAQDKENIAYFQGDIVPYRSAIDQALGNGAYEEINSLADSGKYSQALKLLT